MTETTYSIYWKKDISINPISDLEAEMNEIIADEMIYEYEEAIEILKTSIEKTNKENKTIEDNLATKCFTDREILKLRKRLIQNKMSNNETEKTIEKYNHLITCLSNNGYCDEEIKDIIDKRKRMRDNINHLII